MLAGLWGLHAKTGPIIRQMSSYRAKTFAAKVVSESVLETLREEKAAYQEMILITRNGAGEITSVQANMPRINSLASLVTDRAVQRIRSLSGQQIPVSLGSLLGPNILTGRGPKVPFRVVPTGYVQYEIRNEFRCAGINQTIHRIILHLEVGVTGLIPCYSADAVTQSDICLAETIIIGQVPEYFTEIENADDDTTGMVADYGPGKNR